MITISAFEWVPDFAQGQVRDLRARWALEEAGLPYRTRLLAIGDQDKPEYRALQPFGQVPILEEGGFVLFESGAIVLHIGERSEALLPKDPHARSRAVQWLSNRHLLRKRRMGEAAPSRRDRVPAAALGCAFRCTRR
jgi:glutathione S-transferase